MARLGFDISMILPEDKGKNITRHSIFSSLRVTAMYCRSLTLARPVSRSLALALVFASGLYLAAVPISGTYFTLENCRDLNICKN